MADGLDSIIAQATGQPAAAPATAAPSSGPASISIGTDTPDSTTGTGQGQPAAPATPAGQPQSLDSIISQATGQPDTSTSDSDGGNAPQSGGFVQGLGEGSGLGGVKQAVTAAVQSEQQSQQRALDIYHEMVAAHAKGDNVGAAEAASKFLLTAAQQGLTKSYAPFVEAAKMVVLDPIKSVQETRAKMRDAGNGDMAAGAANEARSVWNKVKQDWQSGSPDRADQVLTDVAAGVSNNAGINAIPLIGPVISSMSNNLDEATHRPGGEDKGRILGNAIGAGAMALAGEGIGALGEMLPGGSKVAAGLAEGQMGADAAQTAADTAKAHDSILQANKDTFKNQLDAATQKAATDQSAATEANKANTVETGNANAEATAAHKDLVQQGRDAQHQVIDDTLDREKQHYADQFKQTLSGYTNGAAAPEELAPKVNEGIDTYEKKSHEDFEEGMTGGDPQNPTEDSVVGQLAGKTEPVMGSPLQDKAAQLLKKPVPGDHPLNLGAKNLAGVKLDANVSKWLKDASEGMMDVEAPGPADEAGKPTTQIVRKPMGDLNAEQLIGVRQNLREAASQFQRGDLNRRVLGDMINATDQTLEKLAGNNTDALAKYDQLRANYKTARANLDTSVADKLRLDSPDKAMGDVNKYLLQGNNAAAKIQTIGSMLGEETMQGLRQSYVQQLADMGPEEAAKALRKIPANVKQAFFGPELDGRLAAAQSVYEKSVTNAETEAAARKQYVTDSASSALGDQTIQAKYDRQANSAAAQKETARIASEYADAVKTAKDLHATQSAPYSTGFAKAISDGTIGEKLATDKIATEDIDALKQALTPEDFAKIQKGIVNRQLAATTVGGNFNPAKFLDWYNKIPEPARNAFFTDVNGKSLTMDMSAVKDAAKLQNLMRAGLVTAGGAGLTVVPHTALAGLLEVAAGAAAVSKKELIANILDTVAANPKYLTRLSKVAPGLKIAANAVRNTTRAATVAGPVLGPSFGRRVRVNGQTGTVLGNHPDSGKPFVEWDK